MNVQSDSQFKLYALIVDIAFMKYQASFLYLKYPKQICRFDFQSMITLFGIPCLDRITRSWCLPGAVNNIILSSNQKI